MKPSVYRFFLPLMLALFALLALSPTALAEEAFRAGPDGLRLKDLQPGDGPEARAGMVATIHFIGWLDERGARGREIYNSRAEGREVSFMIGTDGVMQGWNEGVIGMKPGGARMLLVPPGLAYGKRSIEGVIPANAAMMFRIELVRLENPAGS
ncbi:MAG: FKBP-type peptidyl-prolyl cis-trans isomerase [Lysobacterales bacterium]